MVILFSYIHNVIVYCMLACFYMHALITCICCLRNISISTTVNFIYIRIYCRYICLMFLPNSLFTVHYIYKHFIGYDSIVLLFWTVILIQYALFVWQISICYYLRVLNIYLFGLHPQCFWEWMGSPLLIIIV